MMLRGTVQKTLWLVLLSALAVACGPATDAEQELREWVVRGEDAASREDRGELMDMISSTYADARGNGQDEIDRMLRYLFLRQDNVSIVTHIEELNVYGETAADITLTAGMAGSNESPLGFSADALRFQLELEKDGKDWLLTAARWGELGEDLR